MRITLKNTNKIKVFLTLVGFYFLPLLALAGNINSLCDIANLLGATTNVFKYVIYLLSTIALLYAAFLYLTSAGDPSKVSAAKSATLWAFVGVAFALISCYLCKTRLWGDNFRQLVLGIPELALQVAEPRVA